VRDDIGEVAASVAESSRGQALSDRWGGGVA
jgi:hypothetical protein